MHERITDLDDPAFAGLFTGLRQSWFRLEVFQHYDVSYEQDEFTAFLHGEDPGAEPDEWQDMIRAHVAAGRKLQRVHVIQEPLTAYIRYELAAYRASADAGEDIRLIPYRAGEWPRGVPYLDYWLFDERELWWMDYDWRGRFLSAMHRTAPDDIERAIKWRDAALEQSIPLAEYAARIAA